MINKVKIIDALEKCENLVADINSHVYNMPRVEEFADQIGKLQDTVMGLCVFIEFMIDDISENMQHERLVNKAHALVSTMMDGLLVPELEIMRVDIVSRIAALTRENEIAASNATAKVQSR